MHCTEETIEDIDHTLYCVFLALSTSANQQTLTFSFLSETLIILTTTVNELGRCPLMKWGSNAGTCRKCDGVDGGVNTDAQGIWETARSRVRPGKVGRGRGEDEVRKASRDLLRTGQLSCSFVSIFTWCSMTLKPAPLALPTSSTATRQNWHLSSEGLILPHSQRISKLILIFQTEHYHINRVSVRFTSVSFS